VGWALALVLEFITFRAFSASMLGPQMLDRKDLAECEGDGSIGSGELVQGNPLPMPGTLEEVWDVLE
jgi:hypothetical protein